MFKFITQNRRGTTQEWLESAEIPLNGEFIIEDREDGQRKFKIGNGVDLFKDLPYTDDKLEQELLSAHNRISELVKDTSTDTNDINTEVRDIRSGYGNAQYVTAGDAVRAVGEDVYDLRNSLSQFINADAVSGLHYENNMLYLTANGEIIEESGVQILQGSGGGGGGSASSSSLKIGYITTSPVIVTPTDKAVLKFTFTGVDSSGDAIMQASATWKIDGKVINYGIVTDGENEFDVTKYLKVGTSKVLLTVVDDSGAIVTKNWSVQQVDVRIESLFNDKITYSIDDIIFDYVPYGAVDKTIHFILDGNEIGTTNVAAKVSGTTMRYELPKQSHGSHLLEVYITSTINDIDIESNHIYKDILWYDATLGSPVIGTTQQKFTANQYETTNIEYTVYDPKTETPSITILVDDVVVSTPTLTQATNTYSFVTTKVGEHTIKIICGETVKVITATINELGIDISPVELGLVFDFNPVGRSNSDADRLWKYNDISMSVSDNFDWINGGYQLDSAGRPYFCVKSGTTATINHKLFGDDAKRTGKEVKLIFKTTNVSKPDTTIVSCIDNTNERDHIGLEMKAHEARIYGQAGNLELAYSEDDIIEFEFNISNNTEAVPMIMGYEDGVSTRPLVYNSTYNFKQYTPKDIVIGSLDCDIHIYRFKAYETSLTAVDILNNFIADAGTTQEMLSRYERNQIYDENQNLTAEVLAEKCPWLRVYKLSAPHFTNNKSDKVKETTIQQIYKGGDPVLDNWVCYGAQHSGQGTSSNNYGAAGRNLDFIMNKDPAYFELGDGTETDKITLTRESVPVAYLNAKVNIASSNNLTNAILANRYNKFNPYRRPFIREEGTNLDYIKDTMEFHNCVIFIQESDPDLSTHREFADTDWHFYAIGNIGDSKKTDDTRLTDPDDKYECCVELMDVELPLSDFPVDTMMNAMGYTIDEKTEERVYTWATNDNLDILYEKIDGEYVLTKDLEIDYNKTYYVDILEHDDFSEDYTYGWRYLWEDGTDEENEEVFNYCKSKWIEAYRFITTSSDADFKAHLGDYFVLDSVLYYYLFTTRYCMVDNRAKNTFWHYSKTTDKDADGNPIRKWDLCWDYDNDTSLGLNNYGKQVYRYGLEDTDRDETGTEVFREMDSTFFCRVRDLFGYELRLMYNDLESKNAWHAASFLTACDAWQEEFPEELWRVDIERKYIRTYTSSFISGPGDSQFLENMSNGRMKYQRRQWERSQERYMASKYQTAAASGDAANAQFRAGVPAEENPAVNANYQFTLTPYSYMYLTVRYGGTGTTPITLRARPGIPTVVPYEGTYSDLIYVYSAADISDFGDLSPMYLRTASIGNAPRVKRLILGNETKGYANPNFNSLTTGANALLEELNIENVTGLQQSLDLSKMTNLQKLYAFGSNITGVIFADGGKISDVEVPALTSLTLTNLLYLQTDKLKLTSFDQVNDLTVESCPLIDAKALLLKCNNLRRVRLIDIAWTNLTYEFFQEHIFKLRGINSDGEETGNAWLTGTAHFEHLTGTEYQELLHRYPQLNVTYDTLECIVTFKDTDLVTTVYTQTVYNAGVCQDPVLAETIDAPVREQSVSHTFTWDSWSTETDYITPESSPLENVIADIIVYPTFTSTIRQYKISFYNNDNTLLNAYDVDYGTAIFEYPAETPKKGSVTNSDAYMFTGWSPEAKNIVGDLDCYATYQLNPDAIYDVQIDDILYLLDADAHELSIINYINPAEKIIRIQDTYHIDGIEYTVTGILGRPTTEHPDIVGFQTANIEYIIFPNTLKTIGYDICKNNTLLTEITIPASVEFIYGGAFEGIHTLQDVYYNAINAKVVVDTSVSPRPFQSTKSKTGYNVHIGKDVTAIPNELFKQQTATTSREKVINTLTFEGDACATINEYAFANTYIEQNVTLPANLIEIGREAFAYCNFTAITLPEGLTTLGSDIFAHCDNLALIVLPSTLSSVTGSTFRYIPNVFFDTSASKRYLWKQQCLIDIISHTLLLGCKHAVIPDDCGIKYIANNAFEYVDELTELHIPHGVEEIGQRSISFCKNLKSVTMADTVTTLNAFAIVDNSLLENMQLSMNLTTFRLFSMQQNTMLKSMTFPAAMRTLSHQTLAGSPNLEDVTINSSNFTFAKASSAEICELFDYRCTALKHVKLNFASTDETMQTFIKDAPWGSLAKNIAVEFTDTTLVYNIE